ncbi:MAG: FAD-dependent oxidoreductase [Alphaproteobacteria bacterium]|nr:FAD-dependent oxidoreductase [Alphaproteobacteria bacterium]
MNITRRQLGGFAALLPFSSAVSPAATGDPDVVIVGAGAAGIAAAKTLIDGGRRVQVIEAAARIGGRCYTDRATFGVPFDRGAAWIRSSTRNALTGLARLYSFDLGTRDANEMLFANGALHARASNPAFERAFFAYSDALAHAADEDGDVAASEIAPPVLDDDARAWMATVAAALGPLDMGVDLNKLSAKDWFQRDENEADRLVRQGLGTLVARLAANIPIAVNTRARRVSVGQGRVRVETERGTISAKAAIVTASIGVLTSGAIAFDPGLDASMLGALSGLQMGLQSKIALRFAPGNPALAYPDDTSIVPQVRDERGHSFLVRPFGAPLVICLTGGSLAWDLSTQVESTNVGFARERLRALLGSKADQGFTAGAATDWGTNPNTLGAFAAALPGQWKARAALAAPIGERVFLAGEALAGKNKQTVHGAHESGLRAGRRVLQLLKS